LRSETGENWCAERTIHVADKFPENKILTPHGAGLAHLLVAKPGLRVFEFMPAQAGTE
jgi:hypothetical protein